MGDQAFNEGMGLYNALKSLYDDFTSSRSSVKDLTMSTDDKLRQRGYDSGKTTQGNSGSNKQTQNNSLGQMIAAATGSGAPETGYIVPDEEESKNKNKTKDDEEPKLHYNVNYDPETQKWKTYDPENAEKWLGFNEGPSDVDPLSMSYGNAYEFNNPLYYDENFTETIDPERIYTPMSQGDEYRDYLTTDEGQRFLNTYGYDTYEKLRASGDLDAYATLLGLRDGTEGIKSWVPRYSLSGVDFSDSEKAEENLRNWLLDHVIDVGEYERGNRNIKLANDLTDSGSAARYLYGNTGWQWAADVAEKYGLDEDDVALLAMAIQAENEGLDNNKQVKLAKAWEDAASGMGGKKIKSAPIRSKDYDARTVLGDDIAPLSLSSDLDMNVLPEGEYKSQAEARQAYDQAMARTLMNIAGNDGNRRLFFG